MHVCILTWTAITCAVLCTNLMSDDYYYYYLLWYLSDGTYELINYYILWWTWRPVVVMQMCVVVDVPKHIVLFFVVAELRTINLNAKCIHICFGMCKVHNELIKLTSTWSRRANDTKNRSNEVHYHFLVLRCVRHHTFLIVVVTLSVFGLHRACKTTFSIIIFVYLRRASVVRIRDISGNNVVHESVPFFTFSASHASQFQTDDMRRALSRRTHTIYRMSSRYSELLFIY